MHIEELQVRGSVLVNSIGPCPVIAAGEGSVVTARFCTREVQEIVRVEILGADGAVETLAGTANHPIWSIDRQDWVPLGELEAGEQLLGADGVAIVLAVRPLRTAVPVYNIEVHGEHVYEVGDLGLLVHNNCAPSSGVRGLWNLTSEGASRVMSHSRFGKFFQSKPDGLWWAVDNAEHGGSAFKVFKETGKGLEWYRDADRYGDFIIGKHKGPTGLFIPWKELLGR
jgi:hypothetical protein